VIFHTSTFQAQYANLYLTIPPFESDVKYQLFPFHIKAKRGRIAKARHDSKPSNSGKNKKLSVVFDNSNLNIANNNTMQTAEEDEFYNEDGDDDGDSSDDERPNEGLIFLNTITKIANPYINQNTSTYIKHCSKCGSTDHYASHCSTQKVQYMIEQSTYTKQLLSLKPLPSEKDDYHYDDNDDANMLFRIRTNRRYKTLINKVPVVYKYVASNLFTTIRTYYSYYNNNDCGVEYDEDDYVDETSNTPRFCLICNYHHHNFCRSMAFIPPQHSKKLEFDVVDLSPLSSP
jgi:hypothetical protein